MNGTAAHRARETEIHAIFTVWLLVIVLVSCLCLFVCARACLLCLNVDGDQDHQDRTQRRSLFGLLTVVPSTFPARQKTTESNAKTAVDCKG